jgi:hypothetical protein
MKISKAASNEMAIMYEMAAAIMAKYRNQRKGEIGVSMKTSGAWRQWRNNGEIENNEMKAKRHQWRLAA